MSLIRDGDSAGICIQELHVPEELADCFDAPADADSIVQGHAESKSAFAQCARTDRRLHPRSSFAIRGQPMIDRGWQSRTADGERLAWVLIHSGESTTVGLLSASARSGIRLTIQLFARWANFRRRIGPSYPLSLFASWRLCAFALK